MKECPILFSASMVPPVLDDRKTQTRRIVKGVPDGVYEVVPSLLANRGDLWDFRRHLDNPVAIRCPYGAPGDRLWVKETWRTIRGLDPHGPAKVGEMCVDAGYTKPWAPIEYVVDGRRENWPRPCDGDEPGKTRVSIHMPRWLSRIDLEVVGVRVERLHDISEDDARAEGVEQTHGGCWTGLDGEEVSGRPMAHSFFALWNGINGRESWDENPWVWVVQFRRVRP